AVKKVEDSLHGTVCAPADRRAGGIARCLEQAHADARLVVDQWKAEALLRLRLADERLLLRTREDRPGRRMVHERQLGRGPAHALTVRVGEEPVGTNVHSAD